VTYSEAGHQMVGGYMVATIARGEAGPKPYGQAPGFDASIMDNNSLVKAARYRAAVRFVGWPHTVRTMNARKHSIYTRPARRRGRFLS
jgi:hypothetical protein